MKARTKKLISQEGGFLNCLGPVVRAGLPLMKNFFKPSTKSVLLPLGLTVAASATATDGAIQKKLWM